MNGAEYHAADNPLLSVLGNALNGAVNFGLSKLSPTTQPKPQAVKPAPTAAPKKTNWVPWAIGGAVALVVGFVALMLIRRK